MSQPYTLHIPKLYPEFIVARQGDLWAVHGFLQTAWRNEYSFWFDEPMQYLIAGPAADLLFICLAGHAYGAPPGEASPFVAQAARAHLAAIAPWPGGYWIAGRVVRDFGPDIWPGMRREERQEKRV